MQEQIKQTIDYVTVAGAGGVWAFTDVIAAINLYLPPVLLLLALLWWIIRYWEKMTGNELNIKYIRSLFKKK